MSKENETAGMELTFHTCLLQVLQERTETMGKTNQFFLQGIKRASNQLMTQMDNKLTLIYKDCDREEVEQAQALNVLIAKKIEEAHEEYLEDHKQGLI